MITGHFSLAPGVKSRATQVPLWALMFAAVWLDIVFVPLFLSGAETIADAPGAHVGYGGVIIHADYTHSLVGAALLSGLFGWPAALLRGRRTGVVIGLVSFSHWILDLIVHRPDLPILPGNMLGLPKFGFGLWRVPAASAVIEFAFLITGAYLYWRAALATSDVNKRSRATASFSAALIVIFGVLVLTLDVTGVAG